MTGFDIRDLAIGRLLDDSLREAAWLHEDSFPGYDGEAFPWPRNIEDSMLIERVTSILESDREVRQCEHVQSRVDAVLGVDGIGFLPHDRLCGCPMYVIAAVPRARLCNMCAERALRWSAAPIIGHRCTRCLVNPIPANAYVHEEQVAFVRVYFHCCDSCAAVLKGAGND
jgi:hypothetical protein